MEITRCDLIANILIFSQHQFQKIRGYL